ncbi:MAG: hypothetical protein AB8B96_05910 [Lysobacterales bacterium]
MMARPVPRLDDLQASVDDLLGILKDESDALVADDLRQLESVTDQKRAMLDSLIDFAEGELKSSHQGSPRWDEFVESLTECRRRNMINGASMSAISNSRQEALRVLYGQDRQDSNYDGEGQLNESAPSRDLGKA